MPRTTLTEQLNDTRRQLARKQLELDASRNTTAAIADELERFKAKVRETALDVKERQDWCDTGFNAVMEELGLPLLPHTFKVKVTVTVTRELEIDVDADDLEPENRNEEGVRAYLDDIDAVREYVSSDLGYGDWELTESEVTEVEAITD